MPTGFAISTPGIYRDTLRNSNGCDSFITHVQLAVTLPVSQNITTAICAGDGYLLPSGRIVHDAGNYIDTLKNTSGCDSVLYTINLKVNEGPVVSVSKSNDVNCTLPTASLKANGGNTYNWTPATGLSNVSISNPVASPVVTTSYKVKVTTVAGCSKSDSITVNADVLNGDGGYLLPTSFTPNKMAKMIALA